MTTATLLAAGHLTLTPGAELLDADDNVIADISDKVTAAEIERNIYRTIHGTARLTLTGDALLWGSQRIRLYLTVASPTETQTWSLGVYLFSTPERRLAASPITWDVDCYDKLLVVDTLVGSSYSVASGSAYIATVEDILGDLGETKVRIDLTKSATTLPSTRTWQLDERTTWLGIVNDLLAAVGYEGLWVDRDGYFRSRPYTLPASRATVWAYDADETSTLVLADRTVVSDITDAPNRWVFYRRDAAQALPQSGNGLYEVVNTNDGPTSVTARGGRTITKVVPLDAADHASLVAQGDAVVADDKRLDERLEVATVPNPEHWHLDVVSYDDDELGGARRYAVEEFSLDLFTGEMRHRWRRVP